ncbi:putative lipoprotein [Botrimarina colliarenosi]|uniref:Putative lipoprotein n=1 Tax=Botrimarina colliarenosi TaxID=2528001 RepID=A0A5C6AHD6_9BACT|nr:hypothetical protein [Botrimarina colliarenosi]TWT99404.1 putative lipoprotein [Botrimarina colliarenosi]
MSFSTQQRAVAVFLCLVAAASSDAAITATDDYSPAYDGVADPWDLGTTTDLYVGDTNVGSLLIDEGSYVANDDAYVGYATTGNGAITVSGAVSTWRNDSWIYLGYRGQGTLTIADSGQVNGYWASLGSRSGAEGNALVTGAGSRWIINRWLEVGAAGTGVLDVMDGGKVSADVVTIADGLGSTGQVTVSGANSLLDVEGSYINDVYVGNFGTGILSIDSGGRVLADEVYVSRHSNASGLVTVTDIGSQLRGTRGVYIGGNSTGVLRVDNDGVVDGGDIVVGDNAAGTLQVGSAGAVNAVNLYVGRGSNGTGVVQFDGGVVETQGLLASPTELLGTGTINARGVVSDIDVTIASAADLQQQWLFNGLPDQSVTLNADFGGTGKSEAVLGAGFRGAGTLSLSGGQVVYSGRGELGYHTGSHGVAVVSGVGTLWNSAGEITVGRNGAGSLTVESGGSVSAGSIALGPEGSGTLSIDADSTLNVNKDLIVNASSNVVLDGATISVGGLIAAPANLRGAGVIRTTGLVSDFDLTFDATHPLDQQFTINQEPGQNVTIELSAQSSSPAKGSLGVGYNGSASLTIADGQKIRSGKAYLGYHPGSNGTAVVKGANTFWFNDSLNIGTSGDGSLTIEQDAYVGSGPTRIGGQGGSVGTLTIRDSDSQLAPRGIVVAHGGVVNVEGGGVNNDFGITEIGGACTDCSLPRASVTVRGENAFFTSSQLEMGRDGGARFVVEGGAIARARFGVTTLYAGDTQLVVSGAGSHFEADLLSFQPSSTSESGPAEILLERGGRFSLNFIFGSSDVAQIKMREGGQFVFLNGGRRLANTASEFFGDVYADAVFYWDGDTYESILNATPGVDYTIQQVFDSFGGYTVLTVGELPGLDGDYNGDGVVDAADYTVWRDNLNESVTLNGDTTPGDVSQEDYDVWVTNYGKVASNNGTQTVPEPNGLLLAVGLANLLLVCRRK